MNAKEDIGLLLLKKCMTITKLAELMSEKTGRRIARSTLSLKLIKNTLKYSELAVILDILGYKIEYSEK